jgi:hypothetical protein
MAKLGAYTVDTVVPQKEGRDMVSTLVAKGAGIQADYSECDDEGRKREIAMECHTSMRTFDEGTFFDGDEEGWAKAYVNGGPVFSVAEVAKLWSNKQFPFSHIENTLMFQEVQPCHSRGTPQKSSFEGDAARALLRGAARALLRANVLRATEENQATNKKTHSYTEERIRTTEAMCSWLTPPASYSPGHF